MRRTKYLKFEEKEERVPTNERCLQVAESDATNIILQPGYTLMNDHFCKKLMIPKITFSDKIYQRNKADLRPIRSRLMSSLLQAKVVIFGRGSIASYCKG